MSGDVMGKTAKNTIRVLVWLAILLSLALLIVLPVPAYAIDDPDSMGLEEIYVNRNLVEVGDMLVYFRYVIDYGTNPTVGADDAFVFRLVDTDATTELGSAVPYAYHEDGYGQGVSAMYFSAADAPTWGQAYFFTITGNPTQFADPPVYTLELQVSDYSTMTDQDDSQYQLGNQILSMARSLEVEWGNTTLLTTLGSDIFLATAGVAYFTYAIPGLSEMAPGIFSSQIAPPDFSGRIWGTNQATFYADRYNGTFIGNSTSALGSLFGVGTGLATGVVALVGIIAAIVFAAVKWGSALPGFIGGDIVMIWGFVDGWIPVGIFGVVSLLTVIYIGYWWFFNKG